MQTREENEITSEFSIGLNHTYSWFNDKFTKILSDSFCEFWEVDSDVKLISISENTNFLTQREEFFVTQIRLNKELSIFIRLSKDMVKSLLENILGPNGKNFNIEKISELEAKILTGFDNFLYKNFSFLIKSAEELPKNNTNYNECNLTFFLKSGYKSLGKIVVKIPVIAIAPTKIPTPEQETFSINNFLKATADVNIKVGSTRIRLNDLKNLEKDDIVVLEQSKSTKMFLKYHDYTTEIRVAPNPAIMTDYEIEDEGAHSLKGDSAQGDNLRGDKFMSNDIYNMWDTIQVEIGAEFEKVKLSLGELKQISEGLVVDIGSVYDNTIELKVEDKIVASGELVIINDRYGVKINQIFTEEKNQASQEVQEAQSEQIEQVLEDDPTITEEYYSQEEPQEEQGDDINEEDFDYSDFDVDDEDI